MIAAIIIAIALQSTPIDKIGDWIVHRDADRMTDKTTIWISTEETPNGNALTYGCGRGRDTMFMFLPTQFVGTVRRDHSSDVTYRIDGGAPISDRWKANDDTIASLGGGTNRLKSAMAGGKILLIRGESYRGTPIEAQFKIDEFDKAAVKVDTSCAGG